MEISEAGLDLIKRSEGFRAEPYRDVAGYATIGYGHKLRPGEQYDHGITEATAVMLLEQDIKSSEGAVGRLVHVAMTQGQFDALVDFVFNLGPGALANSTLLRDLNNKEYALVGLQLLLWDHGFVAGREQEVYALKERRQAELTLWKGTPIAPEPVAV
jgi:lysozyme